MTLDKAIGELRSPRLAHVEFWDAVDFAVCVLRALRGDDLAGEARETEDVRVHVEYAA